MEGTQDASTLNASAPAAETGEIGGLVNSDRPSFDPDGQNLFGTVEDDDAGSPSDADDKGAGEDQDTKDQNAADGTGTDKGGNADDGDEDRFDKHPRFQQIMQERDEARRAKERLEAQMEILTRVVDAPPDVQGGTPKEDDLPYKDLSKMTEEELAEWQANDPKGFVANLAAKIKHELLTDMHRQAEATTRRTATEQTYMKFGEKNKDFRSRWDSGEIKRFIDQNPGHNPMSAYHEIISEEREKSVQTKIDEAVAKAKADTEKEVLARIQSKQKATVLGSGPAINPVRNEVNPKLQDTKRHGGKVTVLADMLRSMRRAGTS